jgi:hypothetical protein
MEQPDSTKPEKRIEAEAIVKAGQTERVQLELYRLNNRPNLLIVSDPDIGDKLTYKDDMLTDGTVYYPVFRFYNHSDQPIKVTVWWIGGGERER